MSQPPAAEVSVEVSRTWDERLWQTVDLHPSGAPAALIGFRCDDDGRVPGPVASALGHALALGGAVLGRWFDEPPAAESGAYLAAPQRGIVRKIAERLTHSEPVDLVLTRSPDVAVRLFDQAWGLQYQFIMVLDPEMEPRFGPAIEAVRTRRAWSDFEIGPPVLAVIAPAVDGDGALLASGSDSGLDRILSLMEREAARHDVRWTVRALPAHPAAAE